MHNRVVFWAALFVFAAIKAFGAQLPNYVIKKATYSTPYLILDDTKKIVQKFGLEPMDLKNTGAIPIFGVDQIYADLSAQKAIFLKFDLSLPGYESKLVPIEDGYTISFEVEDRTVALFFYNYSPSEVTTVANEIRETLQRDFKISPIESAKEPSATGTREPASDDCHCGFKTQALSQIKSSASGTNFTGLLTQCFFSALRGAKQDLLDKFNSVKNFTLNPVKLWHGAVEKYRGVIASVKQIYQSVTHFSEQHFSLDFETTMELGCTIIGQVLPDILIAAVTGAAAVKLANTVVELLLKLGKFKKIVDLISTARRLGHSFGSAKEFFKKVLSDSLSPEAQKWVEKLAPVNMKAAMQMVQTCG